MPPPLRSLVQAMWEEEPSKRPSVADALKLIQKLDGFSAVSSKKRKKSRQ